MSKSKSKQLINSSQEKLLTSNSKLIVKKPENILEKAKIAKCENSIDATDKKENQNKLLEILKRKDKSKVS